MYLCAFTVTRLQTWGRQGPGLIQVQVSRGHLAHWKHTASVGGLTRVVYSCVHISPSKFLLHAFLLVFLETEP